MINEERVKFSRPPVALGSNTAAEKHAQDMLENSYQAHWDRRGFKPYMAYTLEGGSNFVVENVASAGSLDPNDTTFLPRETVREQIASLQYAMVYDDASADWGHREVILNPAYTKVNLGIAYNGRGLTYVQHFETDHVRTLDVALSCYTLQLNLSFLRQLPITQVAVHYDPLPQPMSRAELVAMPHWYEVGPGVGRVAKPPSPGRQYAGLEPTDVVASVWKQSATSLEVEANIRPILPRGEGVYTIVIWAESEIGLEPITNYSLFLERAGAGSVGQIPTSAVSLWEAREGLDAGDAGQMPPPQRMSSLD
ncbi:MAG: CAP domain-containing protein [Dehalococcoidia bacterium]